MTHQTLLIDGVDLEVSIDRDGSLFTVRADDTKEEIEIVRLGEDEIELRADGINFVVPFLRDGAEVHFALAGAVHTAQAMERGRRRRQKEHSMAAPMPGIVLKIFASPGEEVSKGSPLIVLEAMKMEHQITAPYDGTVRSVDCQEGQLVQPGVELIVIDPGAGAEK